MKQIKGGAVRIDGNTNFLEVFFDMIVNSINIECISYESLKGFIFVIEVENGKEVFKSITLGNDYYDKPLSKILIKFTVLDDKETQLGELDNKEAKHRSKKKIEKKTDKKDDFEKEAKLQSTIFKQTWKRDKLALCPSVISYISLNRDETEFLFEIMKKKLQGKEKENNIINFIQTRIINNRQLGIIAMEYAENFVLMSDYCKKNIQNNNSSNVTYACALILSNLIILYLECNIVHCDLHLNNILISPNIKKNNCLINIKDSCSRIIDFGRTKSISNNVGSYKDSIEFIKKILTEIYTVDLEYNSKSNTPQALNLFDYAGFIEFINNNTPDFILNLDKNNSVLDYISKYLQSYYAKPLLNDAELSKIYTIPEKYSTRESFLGILLKYYLKVLKEKLMDTKYEYKDNKLSIHSDDATNITNINKIIQLLGGSIEIKNQS